MTIDFDILKRKFVMSLPVVTPFLQRGSSSGCFHGNCLWREWMSEYRGTFPWLLYGAGENPIQDVPPVKLPVIQKNEASREYR